MTKKADDVLPHSLEAERSVLGAILIHNAAYEQVSALLKPADFYRDAHRRIYAGMVRLLERPGGCVDPVTLKDDLERVGDLEEVGGAVYIGALTDGVPRSTNVEHYAGIVRERALYRALIQAANKLLVRAYEAEEPATALLAAADRALVNLQRNAIGRMRDLSGSSMDLLTDLEYRVAHRGELTGIDTGFKSINEITMGWQPGEMIVLAARPSIGKTTFVVNSAVAGARSARPDGRPRVVAIFSMEMRRQQLEYRVLSSLSGIPLSRLLGGFILGPSEWEKLNGALAVMRGCCIHIDDTAGRTAWDIRSECRRLRVERGNLDLVVVDYIQLMPGTLDRRGATRNEEVTDISRRLKIMADELSVPVLVLSQLSRASEGRSDPRPKLSDLRESGALEQDSDIVCFLHRKHHREGGLTNFIVEKQRNGPTGTVNLSLDRDVTLFTDAPDLVEAPPTEAEKTDSRRRTFARRARIG